VSWPGRRSIRQFFAATAVWLLLLATASPVLASPETLKRSAGNILFAPLDIVLAPVVAGQSLANNMRETDDPRWMRAAYAIPGYAWLVGAQLGGGVIREIGGLLELLPGLGLLFFEADLDPLFDPAESGKALVEAETRPLNIKFGIDYTSAD